MAATTAALGTTELLEQILSHVSFFDLLAARGVSTHWLDVIVGSPLLRWNLFLEADCGSEGLVLNKGGLEESGAGDPADMFRIAPRYHKPLSGALMSILPILKSRVVRRSSYKVGADRLLMCKRTFSMGKTGVIFDIQMAELGGRRNLWEDVYLTMPPCVAVVIGVVVGKREVWATVFEEGGVAMEAVAVGFEKILGSAIEMGSGGEVKLEFGFWVEEV
ncbi:hypothetical protein LTR56_014758 [Elasticomyces elasticus]|nr:hypothetical protein LTR56_014758 [Elasticomyces elasticus]KAK3638842.1 hypothetical protein LTR22_017693 [Elasticomyces elasticus]KAK4913122.1 hypothetical protein LTR49_018487 [Elasticomyces elasticus]KAK5752338.1 hypothetical protein LTS12_017557 [Elasticomyces elasticus]